MPARSRTSLQEALFGSDTDLSGKVIRGAGFTFAGMVLRTLITLGSVAILARLLEPRDFGLIAMATVVTELGALFANFGFGAVLIQKRTVTRLQLDTVFWISLILGVVLAFGVFTASFASAAFFVEPKMGELLRALCWTFVLEEITVVPQAVLARMMRFTAPFYIQIATIMTRACVAVSAAYLGYGVWSLVMGSVAGAAVQAAAFLAVAQYWPRFRFNASFLRANFATSGSYFGGGLLFYVNSNADLMLIGRTLGAGALGFYQNARSLTDEIRSRIAVPLQRVLFPAFSAMQADRDRLQAAILRSGRLLALVVVPIGFGIAAVAPDLVPVLYGPKWIAMVLPLQLISISAAIRAACAMASPIFNSANRVGLSFRVGIAATLFTVVAILIGQHWGLAGVAAGVLVSSVFAIVGYRIALRIVGFRSSATRQILLGPILASIAMCGIVHMVRETMLSAELAAGPRLALLVGVGVFAYMAAALICAKSHTREALALAIAFRKR